jgi:DNA polymerase-4
MRLLGKQAGRYVHAAARGRDLRPVQPLRQPRSVSAQRVLGRATRSPGEIDAVVAVLVERVARRMARGRRAGRSVTLRVRFPDGTHTSRSHTMAYPACAAEQILSAARGLLAAAMPLVARRGITLVGVAVGDLDGGSGARQLALSLEPPRVRGPTAPYPPPTTPL